MSDKSERLCIDDKPWNIPASVTDRHTCVIAHAHAHAHTLTHFTLSLRPQVCWQRVHRETAVRLLSICGTLSSLHLSQHTPSCPAASQYVRLMSGHNHISTQQTTYRVSNLWAFGLWWRFTSALTESILPSPAWAVIHISMVLSLQTTTLKLCSASIRRMQRTLLP